MQMRAERRLLEDGRGRTDRSPAFRRDPASALPAILALQRSAGNQAVTRMLQRSCIDPGEDGRGQDESDIAKQGQADEGAAAKVINEGLAEIVAAGRELEKEEEQGFAPVTPDPPSPGGSPTSRLFESGEILDSGEEGREYDDDDDVEKYDESASMGDEFVGESVDDEERSGSMEDDDEVDPGLLQAPQVMHMSKPRLLRAKPTGDIEPHQTHTSIPGLTSPPKKWKPKTGQVRKAKQFERGGSTTKQFRIGGFKQPAQTDPRYALTKYGTARRAKTERQTSATDFGAGSVVGEVPMQWAEFLALLDGSGGKKRWVQGHFINRRLGGPGVRDNLAPFTYSLNTTHLNSVEKPVIEAIKNGKTVSYSVEATPGGGATNLTDAEGFYDKFCKHNPVGAISAMEKVGTISPKEASHVLKQTGGRPGLTDKLGPGQGARTLNDAVTATKAWIRGYITAAFPSEIVCRVRYYDSQGNKEVGEVHIDNSPKS